MLFIFTFIAALLTFATMSHAAELPGSMSKVMGYASFIWKHGVEILGAVGMVFTGLLAIAVVIPGEQPDKFLAKSLELINKLSRGAGKVKVSFDKKK